tara:strand:+ start:293 stop:457 length:165 start_codon:yes stop_codon:yes gene_type:complete
MKHSVACPCGYETPLVEDEDDIDHELLDIHQEFCLFKPDWGKGKTVAQLKEEEE